MGIKKVKFAVISSPVCTVKSMVMTFVKTVANELKKLSKGVVAFSHVI